MAFVKRVFHSAWYATCKELMPAARQLDDAEQLCRDALLYLPGCVYCGGRASTVDHFRPVISRNGMPSGFCDDLWNIVPCCPTCNSSKGNQHWRTFMDKCTPKSPRGRGVRDLPARIRMLEGFEHVGGKFVQQWRPRHVQKQLEDLKASMLEDMNKHASRVVSFLNAVSPEAPPADEDPCALTTSSSQTFSDVHSPRPEKNEGTPGASIRKARTRKRHRPTTPHAPPSRSWKPGSTLRRVVRPPDYFAHSSCHA